MRFQQGFMLRKVTYALQLKSFEYEAIYVFNNFACLTVGTNKVCV